MSSFPKVNARKIPNRHAQHHLTRTQKHVQTCFIQLNTLFYEARLVLNDFFERLEMHRSNKRPKPRKSTTPRHLLSENPVMFFLQPFWWI
jgi:hypothetical protein